MLYRNTAGYIDASMVVITTGAALITGTVYCFVRRKSDDNWLYAAGTWNAIKPTTTDIPTMTHESGGLWRLAHTPTDANNTYMINCIDSGATCFPDNYSITITDNIALASVCTEVRLAELDAANLPTDIADIPTVTEFNARSTSDPATATNQAAIAAYIDTEVGAIKTVADKLNTAVELDIDVYRFTTNALEQAPTGTIAGNRLVTISILTAGLVPIPGIQVDIYNNAQTVRMTGITPITNSNGQVIVSANDGTYKVRLVKVGYTFTVPETLTVNGDTVVTYYGAPATSAETPPVSPAIRVYEFCFKQDGATPMAVADVKATAKIISLPYDYNGRYHSGQEISGTYSVITGKVYWDIAPGAFVEFNIKNMMKEPQQRHVPSSGTEIRLAEITA